MRGLMMNTPLTITSIMRHCERNYPRREIVSVTADQPRHRYTYADAFRRARQLANALAEEQIRPGDRVATLAWNDHRHFEAYFGVSCSGSVLHTVNPRLFPEQIVYILNHGGARVVLLDPRFASLLADVQDRLEHIERFIVLTTSEEMPDTPLRDTVSYEAFIGDQSPDFDWPLLDEQSASAICYTSGTTGEPKGVVYSHRSTVLHALSSALPDVMNLSSFDVAMPIVPMFHVNAWGTPYTAPMVGAKLVLPGPRVGDRATLHELIEQEGVTHSLGVPTVWLGLLAWLGRHEARVDSLRRVVVGGAACPASLIEEFRDRYGVTVHHSWGMTEMSPVGTYNTLKPGLESLSDDELLGIRMKQGRAVFGVEMRVVDEQGNELPWDGQSVGALQVRGPWVCSTYYKPDAGGDEQDGFAWFDTGDMATIDAEGYMQIADRSKDLIKSGGEWISSIELENIAVNHPAVAEAAVIAIAHPKWSERPLLVVVRESGQEVGARELKAWYRGKVARWWVPDAVEFVAELPHTATGKISKRRLREQFADYRFPGAESGA